MGMTTIQIDKKLVTKLKKMKSHPRQPYNEVIAELLRKNQTKQDTFLEQAQKKKMKELWDNEEDEEWKNA